MLVVALLLALLVGLSLGLLGGGGSILTVPILRYVLGVEGHSAIAVSLFVVGTTSLFGLVAHARRGRVQWRTGLVFGASGMVGAFLAGRVAHLVPAPVLLLAFSLMMFATAFAMLRAKPSAAGEAATAGHSGRLPLGKILAEGLAVGAVTGFVGAGGGFLVVPALVLFGHLPMDIAIGTSLLVIALKSFAGFVGFVGHTPVDWTLALVISAAAVAGSFAGSAAATKVSPEALRRSFGWFVIAMAFFILAQEVPPLLGYAAHLLSAALVAALGTGVVAVSSHFFGRRRPASPVRDARKPSHERPSLQAPVLGRKLGKEPS